MRSLTMAILASGPSLTSADVDAVRAWRAREPAARRVMVINTTFRAALWADYLYACDRKWWKRYAGESSGFAGERWTLDARSAREHGLRHVRSRHPAGLCLDAGVVHEGGIGCGNSGHQALNLAYHLGARTLILLGFDMRRGRRGESHHHGDHPHPLSRALAFVPWIKAMGVMATDLAAAGVAVLNCSRATALTCFPLAALEDVLDDDMRAAA